MDENCLPSNEMVRSLGLVNIVNQFHYVVTNYYMTLIVSSKKDGVDGNNETNCFTNEQIRDAYILMCMVNIVKLGCYVVTHYCMCLFLKNTHPCLVRALIHYIM